MEKLTGLYSYKDGFIYQKDDKTPIAKTRSLEMSKLIINALNINAELLEALKDCSLALTGPIKTKALKAIAKAEGK